jgi:hypothetical protein
MQRLCGVRARRFGWWQSMTTQSRPMPLALPMKLRYEGRGAVLEDHAGQELYFQDRGQAMTVYAALSELHDLRRRAQAANAGPSADAW